MKMYILIRESVPTGFALVAASHASLGTYLKFKHLPETDQWLSATFYKVNDTEFETAKSFDDCVVITESALDGQEVAKLPSNLGKNGPNNFAFIHSIGNSVPFRQLGRCCSRVLEGRQFFRGTFA